MKAFGYLRVSGKGQINGDGPERQEAAIRAYAAGHDIEIVRIYFEKGVCGEVETMERPAFIDMIAELGDVRTVIVERLDRLSRSLIPQETCIQDFTRQGITLLSCDPAEFDLMASDPSRVLVRQVFGAIAQYDKAMLCAKLRAARKRCKLAGKRMEGQRPFGSRDGESLTVGLIWRYRADGCSYEAIANILNADGVSTRKQGGKWFATSVKRILTNTVSTESDKSCQSAAMAA
jgi:DNA invertase Pin-like site-specific DNA recombinase